MSSRHNELRLFKADNCKGQHPCDICLNMMTFSLSTSSKGDRVETFLYSIFVYSFLNREDDDYLG